MEFSLCFSPVSTMQNSLFAEPVSVRMLPCWWYGLRGGGKKRSLKSDGPELQVRRFDSARF